MEKSLQSAVAFSLLPRLHLPAVIYADTDRVECSVVPEIYLERSKIGKSVLEAPPKGRFQPETLHSPFSETQSNEAYRSTFLANKMGDVYLSRSTLLEEVEWKPGLTSGELLKPNSASFFTPNTSDCACDSRDGVGGERCHKLQFVNLFFFYIDISACMQKSFCSFILKMMETNSHN